MVQGKMRLLMLAFTFAALSFSAVFGEKFVLKVNLGGGRAGDFVPEEEAVMLPEDTPKNRFHGEITGATEDEAEVFKTNRFTRTKDLVVEVPIPDGIYTVSLLFAETWNGAFKPGVRVFDVYLGSTPNGILKRLTAFDMFSSAGGSTAIRKKFKGIAVKGALTIALRPIKQNPQICGIVIEGNSYQKTLLNDLPTIPVDPADTAPSFAKLQTVGPMISDPTLVYDGIVDPVERKGMVQSAAAAAGGFGAGGGGMGASTGWAGFGAAPTGSAGFGASPPPPPASPGFGAPSSTGSAGFGAPPSGNFSPGPAGSAGMLGGASGLDSAGSGVASTSDSFGNPGPGLSATAPSTFGAAPSAGFGAAPGGSLGGAAPAFGAAGAPPANNGFGAAAPAGTPPFGAPPAMGAAPSFGAPSTFGSALSRRRLLQYQTDQVNPSFMQHNIDVLNQQISAVQNGALPSMYAPQTAPGLDFNVATRAAQAPEAPQANIQQEMAAPPQPQAVSAPSEGTGFPQGGVQPVGQAGTLGQPQAPPVQMGQDAPRNAPAEFPQGVSQNAGPPPAPQAPSSSFPDSTTVAQGQPPSQLPSQPGFENSQVSRAQQISQVGAQPQPQIPQVEAQPQQQIPQVESQPPLGQAPPGKPGPPEVPSSPTQLAPEMVRPATPGGGLERPDTAPPSFAAPESPSGEKIAPPAPESDVAVHVTSLASPQNQNPGLESGAVGPPQIPDAGAASGGLHNSPLAAVAEASGNSGLPSPSQSAGRSSFQAEGGAEIPGIPGMPEMPEMPGMPGMPTGESPDVPVPGMPMPGGAPMPGMPMPGMPGQEAESPAAPEEATHSGVYSPGSLLDGVCINNSTHCSCGMADQSPESGGSTDCLFVVNENTTPKVCHVAPCNAQFICGCAEAAPMLCERKMVKTVLTQTELHSHRSVTSHKNIVSCTRQSIEEEVPILEPVIS